MSLTSAFYGDVHDLTESEAILRCVFDATSNVPLVVSTADVYHGSSPDAEVRSSGSLVGNVSSGLEQVLSSASWTSGTPEDPLPTGQGRS